MKKFFIFTIFMLLCFITKAQESLINSDSFILQSKILGEDRVIDIHLPKNYKSQKFAKANYPVIYVLDGDRNFPMITALEIYGTHSLYRPFPEMIVVGIRNIDRNKDYTPTIPNENSDAKSTNYPTAGGADNFLSFLNNELRPYIDNNYRTNGYNILHGHSFGGLFALYTWASQPNSFSGYIAIDPSLWWDDQFVFKKVKTAIQNNNLPPRNVFIALAYESPKVAKDRLKHGETIREFCEKLLTSNSEIDQISDWKYYPDKDHGSVSWPSGLDALTSMFEGIRLDVKQVPNQPELVRNTYEALSKKLNHRFIPEESLLIDLIQYTQKQNKVESVRVLTDYYKELYPNSEQLLRKFNN